MDQLTELFGQFWAVLILFGFLLFLAWPSLVFFAVWRLLRDVRAMRQAIEHVAYERPRHVAAADPAASPSIGLSAFGR